jgi:hypothetical protein
MGLLSDLQLLPGSFLKNTYPDLKFPTQINSDAYRHLELSIAKTEFIILFGPPPSVFSI